MGLRARVAQWVRESLCVGLIGFRVWGLGLRYSCARLRG